MIGSLTPMSLPLPGSTFADCARGGVSSGCKVSLAVHIREAHRATATHCDWWK